MTISSLLRTRLRDPAVLRGLIALVALIMAGALQWQGGTVFTTAADEWLRDRFIQLQAADTRENRVLVIDIDESSVAQIPWPWPRARIADLIELALADGARGIALDILMEKPADADGDMRLAMLAGHGPVVLAQMFDYLHADTPLASGRLVGGSRSGAGGAALDARGYLANHTGLGQARYAGNIGVLPDADGILRRLPMFTNYQGRVYPTLSLALLQCCGGATSALPVRAVERVPYVRDWGAYDVVKAADLLAGRMPAGMARGRLVLIGSSSLSIGDRVATPLGASSAGLLVHASMLTSLLDRQQGLAPTPLPGKAIAFVFVLAIVLLTSYTLPRVSAAANALLLGASALAWLALAWLLAPRDPDFAPAAPLLCCLYLLAVAVPFQWELAQRRSRQLLGTLRQYVAGEVVDELLRSDLKDPLAPRRLEVTTLVADMQGYTSQVEALSLEEASRLTTEFLECLTRPVLAHRGTLDKYTGDGLVAFWGAPLPNADHADLALDAAARILHEVAQFSALRVASGLPALRVRIGIESGVAMAGDYGTAARSIYTAVGDSVNTAARLEQTARDYPHDVIIGEGTAALARRHRLQLLGEHQLRGKGRPTRIYTLERSE
ncbi:adenylate/guanylate cyclase domain-containing protein [Massilia sp.]|uniref:CHASE2 domain-containing protein n=1 Tax=Massilia sp. TaxID=1882437 RepID=UPI00289F2AC4|nr:adenylate/guanylate cyclase domain-containing protein [Massilia sp.]